MPETKKSPAASSKKLILTYGSSGRLELGIYDLTDPRFELWRDMLQGIISNGVGYTYSIVETDLTDSRTPWEIAVEIAKRLGGKPGNRVINRGVLVYFEPEMKETLMKQYFPKKKRGNS